jgi:hypothetical protein
MSITTPYVQLRLTGYWHSATTKSGLMLATANDHVRLAGWLI